MYSILAIARGSGERLASWFGAALIGLAVSASPAAAHARWVVNDKIVASHPAFQMDSLYPAMAVGALIFVVVALFVDMAGHQSPALHRLLCQPVRLPMMLGWRILSMALGGTLIINSMERFFIAPNFPAGNEPVFHIVTFLQIVIGSMFLLQSHLTVASLLVLVLPIISLFLFSLVQTIDYAFELVGLGLSLLLVAPLISPADKALQSQIARHCPTNLQLQVQTASRTFDFGWQSLARSEARQAAREVLAAQLLRTMLGVQLIVLAAHDKLLEPGVSLAFVDAYSFVNIPALLGASRFTNLHFVFGAGLAEIVFGALLVANVAARPVSMILAGMFILSGLAFGIAEMVGHVPIVATLLILIAHGSDRPVGQPIFARWQLVSLNVSGVTLATLIWTFAVTGLQGGAATDVRSIASITTVNPAVVVPGALYDRFTAELARTRIALSDEVSSASIAVRSAIDQAGHGEIVDKDELARRLLDLSIRYEMTHGRDGASQWLRFAHLTASCSHDDVQAFRSLVAGPQWQDVLARVPPEYVAALMPIARAAAEAITAGVMDISKATSWKTVSVLAPGSGVNYVHTHTLASISRILLAASVANPKMQTALAGSTKG